MQFYLDDILLVNEPSGDITTTIKRDAELSGYLITNDAKLSFWGDGYDYIQSRLEATGYCGEIDIKINDECNGTPINIFVGKIFLLQIEKNNNCIITTPLQDNNYYARISKNKNIKTFIDSTRSKNNQTIAAAATNAMEMFVPATGATISAARQGWRVYDVFKNLVSFLSDGEMTFDSKLLGIGGEFEGLSITTGQEIFYQGTGVAPQISFSDFFTEVNKKLHLALFIDLTGTAPKMFIESDATTYTNNIIKKLEAVGEVTFKVDASKLIAKVVVGSTTLDFTLPGGGVSFVESNRYFTFNKEEYASLGQCNTDSSLDLVSNYILSSNIIEDCLLNTNNNFSDRIFFIDCENVVASGSNYISNAIEGNPFFTSPPYFYNTRLMNKFVLERWNSALPQEIVNFNGTINNLFRAANTDAFTSYIAGGGFSTPFKFNNDYAFPNFDGNGIVNNYGNGTAQGTPVATANSRFTCPEYGTYTFFVQIEATTAGGTVNSVYLEFERHNAATAIVQTDGSWSTVSGILATTSHQVVMACNSGDYIVVNLISGVNGMDVIGSNNQTFFACTDAPNSGGIIVSNNESDVSVVKADFEYSIKNTDYYDIERNLFDKIAFTFNIKNQPQINSGWIDIIKYNHNTSDAKITLRGTQKLIQ